MVNKDLTVLILLEHDLGKNKILPVDYFESRGFGKEGFSLEKQGFVCISKIDGEKVYCLTNMGKNLLSELDEYYEIISVENQG